MLLICSRGKMSSVRTIERVIDGRQAIGVYRSGRRWSDVPPDDAILLSGSFRPLHRAHRTLLEIALEISGKNLTPCFELSVRNVEKPDIAVAEIQARVAQFDEPNDTVLITRAATFLEKARLMPGSTFVIGYDTAIRLFDDRFYPDSQATSPSVSAMTEFRNLGSSFIVGGRHDEEGSFRTVRDVDVPSGFESLLLEIPEHMFADPISSTQIRQQTTAD